MEFRKGLKRCLRGAEQVLWRWLYPACCRRCLNPTGRGRVFCNVCIEAFTFLDPRSRCPFCFEQVEGMCLGCLLAAKKWRLGTCWEGIDAVIEFLAEVSRGRLSTLAAHALLIQWSALRWPLPDLIIPIPTRGSTAYIETFARALQVSCRPLLKKAPGFLPQRELPLAERYKPVAFTLKRDVKGKRILLIDDFQGTGATLQGATTTLLAAGATVDALTLSRLFIDS